MTSQRELFGGAITVFLPTSFIDASNLRQVPDTQEVFLAPDSDVSFIVEILQKVDANDLSDAVRFHFDSLAHDSDAESSVVHSIQSVPLDSSSQETPAPIILDGSQRVAKFNRTTLDEVRVMVALFRIESKNVDIVFTANLPVKTEDEGALVDEGTLPAARESFLAAARSLRILDFGLFA